MKATEFHNLVQGWMSVVEYAHKFNEIAQYAPNEVPNDEAKRNRFEHGLTPVTQDKIYNASMADFNEMVSAAIKAETKKSAIDRIEGESRKRAAFN